MGSFSSKLMKHNCSSGLEEKEKSKDTIEISDPRSPTDEIVRTPITIEKDKRLKEDVIFNNGRSNLMRQKLMKNLKLDPRSPTDGISRTPIILENTPTHEASKGYTICESPLSIYSHNFNDLSIITDLATPSEPSINVSGFDKDPNVVNFINFNDSIQSDESKNKLNEKVNSIVKTPLVVSSKPSTAEARKILNEILSSKEFEQEVPVDLIKQEKPQKNKSLSVHCDHSESKVCEKKKDKPKYRTPLSNITLSSNSPNCKKSMKKQNGKGKIHSYVGLENSESPKIRQVAEWDKDKTVII